MKEDVKKRILITSASNADPYTIRREKYNDGPIMAILRKKIREGKPITDIYIYLSLEMAIIEFDKNRNIIKKAIEGLYKRESKENKNLEINIVFFPKVMKKNPDSSEYEYTIKNDVIDKIEEYKNEIDKKIKSKEEELEKNVEKSENIDEIGITLETLKDKVEIAEPNAHKFGVFYSAYYEMFEEASKYDNAEVYVNVTSGTPAMQEDISLIALTNKNVFSEIMQVSTPGGKSNNRAPLVKSDEDELNKLQESENDKNRIERVVVEKMLKTRKLMLLHSLEDSFQKHDFAGVYNAIKTSNEIENSSDIFGYAKNLYFRYIGNDENARKSLKGNSDFIQNNEKELYPIFDDDSENVLQLRNLIERINIMNVKAERQEINDWLLLAETTIEYLYTKLIYITCDKLDINSITDNGKITSEKFDEVNDNSNKEYECLRECVNKVVNSNRGFPNAYFLKDILDTWWEDNETNSDLEVNVAILDKIRSYRNLAAHTDLFITKDILQNGKGNLKGFNTRIDDENNYRRYKLNPERNQNGKRELEIIQDEDLNNVIKITNKKIVEILERILNSISKYTIDDLHNSLNVYDTIQEKILSLLKDDIKKLEVRNTIE